MTDMISSRSVTYLEANRTTSGSHGRPAWEFLPPITEALVNRYIESGARKGLEILLGLICSRVSPALLTLWAYPVGGRMYSTTGLCPLDARGDLHPHRDHQRMSLAIIKCLLVTELPPVENCFSVPTTPSTNGSYQIP